MHRLNLPEKFKKIFEYSEVLTLEDLSNLSYKFDNYVETIGAMDLLIQYDIANAIKRATVYLYAISRRENRTIDMRRWMQNFKIINEILEKEEFKGLKNKNPKRIVGSVDINKDKLKDVIKEIENYHKQKQNIVLAANGLVDGSKEGFLYEEQTTRWNR